MSAIVGNLFLTFVFASLVLFSSSGVNARGKNRSCDKGMEQSPIPLMCQDATKLSNISALKLTRYDKPYCFDVSNVGNTVKMRIRENSGEYPEMTGGFFGNQYIFEVAELHWPSAHVLGTDKKRYDLELSLFHAKKGNIHNQDRDYYSILSVLYKLGDKNNDVIGKIADALPKEKGAEKEVCDIKFESLLPKNIDGFFVYPGSQRCIENAIYTVFTDIVELSNDNLKLIKEKKPDVKSNNRDLQEVNGRPIYTSKHVRCE